MEPKKSSILILKNVHLSIGNNKILKALSFQIRKNEIVSIVGESGSGKSMIALCLMGLQPKNAKIEGAEFTFELKDLKKLTSEQWRINRINKLGIVFQEPQTSLNPSIRIEKQLLEVLQLNGKFSSGKSQIIIKKVLEDVLLTNTNSLLKAYPHELSGGQKQRIMIAIALLCKPKLLIADEPTTALDVTVQKEIIQLLKSLQKKYQMSILFISHDLALVKQLADRVLVMHKGTIVESGNSSTIFQNPRHPYTKGLLFARPEMNARLKRLPTINDYQKGNFKIKYISKSTRKRRHEKIYAKKPILEVIKLEKIYLKKSWYGKPKRFKALNPISFSLYRGESLGLVGESGCGKSTLAKTLVFLDPATSGKILWMGNKINPINKIQIKELRNNIQFIFQDPYASLHPQKTIGSTIEEVLYCNYSINKDDNRLRMLKLLKQVGLSQELIKRYPHEISGGQCQRVAIARALAVEPKVLICDESVAALDISIQAQVLNLLNDLKEELGLSFIFISHNLAIVKYMSDRIMVMREGSLIELQEADTLYINPKNNYTRKLIQAIPN